MRLDWNVETIIALVVIIAFASTALSGVEEAGILKDVVLCCSDILFWNLKRKRLNLLMETRKFLQLMNIPMKKVIMSKFLTELIMGAL